MSIFKLLKETEGMKTNIDTLTKGHCRELVALPQDVVQLINQKQSHIGSADPVGEVKYQQSQIMPSQTRSAATRVMQDRPPGVHAVASKVSPCSSASNGFLIYMISYKCFIEC